jgi:hypothetical protein
VNFLIYGGKFLSIFAQMSNAQTFSRNVPT